MIVNNFNFAYFRYFPNGFCRFNPRSRSKPRRTRTTRRSPILRTGDLKKGVAAAEWSSHEKRQVDMKLVQSRLPEINEAVAEINGFTV